MNIVIGSAVDQRLIGGLSREVVQIA